MINNIEDHPIPILYKNILKEKTSGELTITLHHQSKSVYFDNGNIIFAKSNVIQERLGEILYKAGKITQAQFWNLHKLMEGTSDKIGKILIQNNILSQKEVFFGLLSQIRIIALSLFELDSGQWEFQEKKPDIPEDSSFSIELPSVIVEGMKKLKNLSFYKNKFKLSSPYITDFYSRNKDQLTEMDQNILNNLSDHKNTPAEKLVALLEMEEGIFWTKMITFYLLNVIDFNKVQVEKIQDKNIDELLKYYDKIKYNKIDYYELFGIKNSAQIDEIKDAYFSFAKKFHPDRIDDSADSEVKEKANTVFAFINKAYDTLSNENRRMDYDSKGYKEDDQENSNQGNMKEKARILYLKARTLYNKKQYWEAATLLDEANKLDKNRPAYILLHGLSQMNTEPLRRMAEKNLKLASELEPWNPEPLIALGKLFQKEGLFNRAETFFRQALSLNPDNEIAKKRLDELTKGSSIKKSIGSFFGKKKKTS